jgi:hypothetical protein
MLIHRKLLPFLLMLILSLPIVAQGDLIPMPPGQTDETTATPPLIRA